MIRMKMTRRVVVQGGRFTANRTELFGLLDYNFDPHGDAQATDVLMTEVSPARYRRNLKDYIKHARKRFGKKLYLWHPRGKGANECVIISDRRMPRWHRGAQLLTQKRIKVGRTAPIELVFAKLWRGPWWSIWHTPAHNFGLRRGVWATIVYRSGLPKWRRWLRLRSQSKHGAGAGADFNLGLERDMVREELLKDVHGYRFTVEPNRHTIIGLATNMTIVEPSRKLKEQDGFDHPGELTVLESL